MATGVSSSKAADLAQSAAPEARAYLEPDLDGRFVVPDAELLFSGSYSRVGPDLQISNGAGNTVLLPDYFALQEPPSLFSPDGAVLTGDVVSRLAGPRFPLQFAQAGAPPGQSPIGQVETISGSVRVTHSNGGVETLGLKSPVYLGDIVETAAGASVGITFADRTVLAIDASSRMTLDQFVYNPGGSGNSSLMNLIQGSFSFIAGQIAPTGEMRIETPVSSMAIRGTTGRGIVLDVASGTTGHILFRDPPGAGGGLGAIDVNSKVSGNLLRGLRAEGEGVIVRDAAGNIDNFVRTPEQLAAEQIAISLVTASFIAQQIRINSGDPVLNPVPGGLPPQLPPSPQPGQQPGDPTQPGQPAPQQQQQQQPQDGQQQREGSAPQDGTIQQAALGIQQGLGDSGVLAPIDASEGSSSNQILAPLGAIRNVSLLGNENLALVPLLPNEIPIDASAGPIVPIAVEAALQAVLLPPSGPAPPSLILPSVQSVFEDGTVVISGFSIGGPGSVIVSLSASSTITLASINGLSFTSGDGTADHDMVFSGSPENVNVALNGLTYQPTPDNDTFGRISITVALSDGTNSVSGTLTIAITPTPDPPVDGNETMAATEDTSLNVTAATGLLANATDADRDPLAITSVTVNGTTIAVTAAAPGVVTFPGLGTLTIGADGAYSFILAANATGTVPLVTYTVSDGVETATSTLVISIAPVNDPPVDGNETVAVTEDTPLSVPAATGLLANAIDADGDQIAITSFAVNGVTTAVTTAAPGLAVIAGLGTLTISADGGYSFTPVANATGVVPLVTYTVSDGVTSDTSTLSLAITPVNDPPVDADDTVTVTEDTPLSVPAATGLLANAIDADGDQLTITSFVVNGVTTTVTAATPGVAIIAGFGTLTISADGGYSFTPVANATGVVPLVTYTVSDGVTSDTSTLNLAITPVNDPPVDGNETVSVTEDTLLSVPAATGLLANAADAEGDALSITSFTVAGITYAVNLGAAGVAVLAGIGTLTVASDGAYTFDPVPNFDRAVPLVTYTVSDGTVADTSSLFISMTPVPDQPVITGAIGNRTITANTSGTIDLSAFFATVDTGDILTYSATRVGGGALPGWLTINPVTGALTGTPVGTDFGTIAVTVTATSTAGLSSSQNFNLSVGPDVVGTPGNDTLIGNNLSNYVVGLDGNDTYVADAGNDVFDGGTGTNTIDYSNAPIGVTMSLLSSTAPDGFGGTDILLNVQNIVGSAFVDNLTGNALDNSIDGGDGNDNLEGGAGIDTLTGGAGDDFLFVDNFDVIDGGPGTDRAQGDLSTEATGFIFAVAGTNIETATGRNGNDFIDGTGVTYALSIVGFGGNDRLIGGAGDDGIIGDDFSATPGGNDFIIGGDGFDQIYGNGGDDILIGGGATAFPFGDRLFGGDGNDTITGSGNGLVVGDAGNDLLFGTRQDWLIGGDGDDVMTGDDTGDQIFGGSQGFDTMFGGTGSRDEIEFLNDPGGIFVSLAAGTATDGWGTTDTFSGIEDAAGSQFNDTIIGDAGDNQLFAAGGNDFVFGGRGNDLLVAGSGVDVLNGGPGNDIINNNTGNPLVFASYEGALAAVTVSLDSAIARSSGDYNLSGDTFIKNLQTGAVTPVATNPSGVQAANGSTSSAVFSPDGSKVAFASTSSDIVFGDTGGFWDIFVKDLATGDTIKVTNGLSGAIANGNSLPQYGITWSADGNQLAFGSLATNLVAGDTNQLADLFVVNLQSGVISRITETNAGVQANAEAFSPVFSPDGKKVLFRSLANNLDAGGGDNNSASDIFMKDLETGVITLISVDSNASQGGAGLNSGTVISGHFSPDGTKVLFDSGAQLAPGANTGLDLFIKYLVNSVDTQGNPVLAGAVERVSTREDGTQSNGSDLDAKFSADGSKIVFSSFRTTDIGVTNDTNGVPDVYVKVLSTGVVTLVSQSQDGVVGNGQSGRASFSPDGTKVLFFSNASNLVANDTNGVADWFIKDLNTGAVRLVSSNVAGEPGNAASFATELIPQQFSPDGTLVLVNTAASNMLPPDPADVGTDSLILIPKVIGSSFNDTLIGSTGNETFRGEAGSDFIDGRTALDTVDYSTSPSGIIANLTTLEVQDGFGSTDTVWNIENVIGSSVSDVIIGTSAANVFDGGGGNDILAGAGGADTLYGGAGDDEMRIASGDFAAIDGGSGQNKLVLDGAFDLDLRGIANANVLNVQEVDLTNASNNTLSVAYEDIFGMAGPANIAFPDAQVPGKAVIISGNTGDALNLHGAVPGSPDAGGAWQASGATTINGQSYAMYNFVSSGGQAQASIAVDQQVTTTILP